MYILAAFLAFLREEALKNCIFSGRTTKFGGGGVIPPEPLRRKTLIQVLEPHETQEKLTKKMPYVQCWSKSIIRKMFDNFC